MDIAALIARARQRDPEAAQALADLVEHAVMTPAQRVSTAFRLKRRGGDKDAERRSERDNALRALARLLYPDLPLEQQSRALFEKAERYVANGWSHERHRAHPCGESRERSLLRQVASSGLSIPRPRQLKSILAENSEK